MELCDIITTGSKVSMKKDAKSNDVEKFESESLKVIWNPCPRTIEP